MRSWDSQWYEISDGDTGDLEGVSFEMERAG